MCEEKYRPPLNLNTIKLRKDGKNFSLFQRESPQGEGLEPK
ncbi:MAG: hypothetical protein Q8S84_07840 [bacterium]|nr:hypothetical protein [bacterium]